jgi:hypothetical protein
MPIPETVKRFEPVAMLRDLAELDYDLVQAYETAIAKLEDVTIKRGMQVCVEDHRRHIVDLNVQIVELGGKPWVFDDFRHVLKEGKVFLASVIGDRGILKAMKSNEREVHEAYARASVIRGVSPQISRLLDASFNDERKHSEWLVQTLDTLEV